MIMLCGTPFSGKSTLARALAERFGLAHIEIDRAYTRRGVLQEPGDQLGENDWLVAFRNIPIVG